MKSNNTIAVKISISVKISQGIHKQKNVKYDIIYLKHGGAKAGTETKGWKRVGSPK